MRRFRDLSAALLAILGTALLPWPHVLQAGLRFQPSSTPAPEGADTAVLSGDGAALWAGTARGVWKLSGATWSLDGLGDRSVTGLAAGAGAVFAAAGQVYRRGSDGTWSVEALPQGVPVPSLLATDGTTVWGGGNGVIRLSGGIWASLASPGSGQVTAMGLDGGNLVVGLSSGSVARLVGTSWVALASGLPPSTAVTALASVSGTLWAGGSGAGTSRGLFSWSGTAWVQEAVLGLHDVRAITGVFGVLRAATADAGILKRSGSSWVADTGSILPPSVRCFGTLGSDLFAGTGGGPVYRSSGGAGWVPAGTGLNGAVVSGLAFSTRGISCAYSALGGLLVGTMGAGLGYVSGPASGCPAAAPDINPPAGCGNVTSVALVPEGPSSATVLAATNCGLWSVLLGPAGFVVGSMPTGTGVTVLASGSDDAAYVGTSSAGVFRFAGGTLVADSTGLPVGGNVLALGTASGTLYASLLDGLFARSGDGTWDRADAGLPDGYVVGTIGGQGTAWAGLTLGGVYRREGGRWLRDSVGLNGTGVYDFDVSRGKLFAAAGTSGVVTKRDGGWAREQAGLPAGANVRVVSRWTYDVAGGAPHSESLLYAGTAGQGLFSASTQTAVRVVPVVLDVVGTTGARFRTELTFGSRAASPVLLALTFRPAPGFGADAIPVKSAALTLSPGQEIRASDALALLRGLGVAIPDATPSFPIAGSLSVVATPVSDGTAPGSSSDDVYVIARTWTGNASGGTFGLFYGGQTDLEGAEDQARIYGLRSVSGVSRSNLAIVHIPSPDRGTDPIQVAVQVYSQSGTPAGSPLTKTLAPGEWYQFNNILGMAGLSDGAYGYAVVTRTSGIGPFIAYGVVNDMATSDGSYLPMFRPGGLSAARRLIVPVVLDVLGEAGSHYTTELTLANDGPIGTPVDLVYQPAPGYGTATGVPSVTVTLKAREQRTIPDVIAYLRANGMGIPDPATSGPQVGTLSVHFRYLDALDTPWTVALARASTPNPDASVGGSFGLFYPAVAQGGGARTGAMVPALTQNAAFRSNLAVVHTGGGSELPITLAVQLYDAATGRPVGTNLAVKLQPGEWFQWSKVLELTGAVTTTSNAYARISRVSGDDTFFAYGVVNDNVTSDGSFVAMIPAVTY
jgi:hypothetical protein